MTAKPLTLFAAALLGLALSAPAEASPSHGRGIGPIHNPGLARGHKDHDCLYRCRHVARVCFSAAREDVHMCVETTCSQEITDVRTACEADPASAECEAAKEALRTCAESCRAEFQGDVAECRSDLGECIEGCPEREPPSPPQPKDRECAAGCRDMLKSCASDARTVADECKATCTTAVDAAHAACEADPASQDCHDKRVAASECLRPCYAMQGQATADCVIKVRECVAGCPDQPQPSGQ